MLISVQWLREFVPYTGTVQELADRLTMQGLEVEAIIDPFESIAGIVVGHVLECADHPDSDHLHVCSVDVGGPEALQIVCGAPNVAKGQKVPVAPIGTTMPGGMQIKKGKLRGVASHGMICSERELGLSEDHEGIMVLPASLRPGQPLTEALGLEREVLEVSITPNRADCLSVLGIARETALGFGLPLTMPALNLVADADAGDATAVVRIEIADGELCPVYRARALSGVTIAKSPDWLRYRLIAIGQRPISNIVDVTNYILMELGQPLHAFDRGLLKGGVVRVAPAQDGMSITTLDGQERKLLGSDLLIWDAERPVALAGVMGGANSSVSDATSEVLLECAIFRPGTIRKTARRLALPSEASYRFERGVDQVASLFALERAAQLMAEVSGARVMRGIAVAEPKPWVTREHTFRIDRCNALLGLELTPEFCKTTLTGLGCGVDDADPANWRVTSPPHRLDLEREVDLFEECGRVHGLDRIPAVLPKISKSLDSVQLRDTEFGFLQSLKAWAVASGLREAVNYSFVGTDDLDRLHLPQEGRIMIANPLSEDQNVLRTEIAPGLLNNVRHNLSQGNASLRLFEIAKAFREDAQSDTGARENSRLGLLVHGARHGQEWPWEQGEADYLDMKGLVENLLAHLRLGPAAFVLEPEHPYLSPCVRVEVPGADGPVLAGRIGRVEPKIADAYHARKDVWLADLDADLLRSLHCATSPSFRNLPKFPPVRRDVTVICPATLNAEAVEAAIGELKPKNLESIALVAVYAPEDKAPDAAEATRNLSFRLTYRHAERTLVDKEVDKEHGKVLAGLPQKLPVRI
ncbi:phenylalanyl-tRNA synthetase beta subunit [Humidesulfovibrio mexicanus]|uniref:Phenylalanine--tRNA ligase beta subunit n=1 Tax=Humidesulfovibrio mexicanus TaxID=147047 RepID=A0A239AP50_9BACT|nr:phenylalanine--tRNA ligase subunit beta [Humidesulfovibrio mexicanus]SNR97427.1 phenylalanyl-tRNA synthetase beta subunit [Humidesulfovibrio mexicanus]